MIKMMMMIRNWTNLVGNVDSPPFYPFLVADTEIDNSA